MSLQLKSEIDLVSFFALIVSISSLAWNYVQWRLNGVRFRMNAVGNLITIPDDGWGKKISLHIANTGGRKIQISSIAFTHQKNRKAVRYMPTNPMPEPAPFAIDVGEMKITYFLQDRLIEMIGEKRLWCEVTMAHKKHPVFTQVKFSAIK